MKAETMLQRSGKLIPMAAVLLLAGSTALDVEGAIIISRKEMAEKSAWVRQNLLTAKHFPPFSFIYDGQPSSELLRKWNRTETNNDLDRNRRQHVLTWIAKNLQVKCVAVEYRDFPVAEWTVYLKNIGTSNTPILEAIQGLDANFEGSERSEFVLNGIKGDWCTAESYEPYRIVLGPNSTNTFAPPESGKSSDGPKGWPYYNLQTFGGGVIIAVGWPGQWASAFTRDDAYNLRVEAGQQLTHLFLKPGEQIRTPLIAMLFWKGTNVVRAQNLWRRFYLAHVIPRVNGQPPSALSQIQVGGALADTNYVEKFLRDGIAANLCWRDAGGANTWYVNSTHGPYKGNDAWLNTGTWRVDTNKYPDGFKLFSDWINARGMKFVLWSEPERVGDPTNSWLGKKHPDWLLHPGSVGLILNEGNREVFLWITNHFDALIKSNGVNWYREDMNGGGPCSSWRSNDVPDRQGITENFYVQGHLAYWDALLAMNPGLRIDSCASGGRRNDLETMRRAVPLLRSDFQWPNMKNVVEGNQCQTYGLSFWLPFQGTGTYLYKPYSFRSFYMASFGMGGLTTENAAAQRQAYRECKQIGPIMLHGDYYPLTSYSLGNDVWIAWQFDWPGAGKGCVQAFRRRENDKATRTFHLNDLDPSSSYEVTNFDRQGTMTFSGQELMTRGLTIRINDKPGAAVIVYKRTESLKPNIPQ